MRQPRRMIKCSADGCDTLVRYDTRRGVCREHTDWTRHATRIAEYNVRVKSKRPEDRCKRDRIPSVVVACVICGQTFLARPDSLRRGYGTVCSGSCHGVRAASLTPKKQTSIETAIENELMARGIAYQGQQPLCGITICDFFLPGLNAAVYCDGDYWHSIPKTVARDTVQNEVLRQNGYAVFRFTEAAIKQSASDCIDGMLG